MFKEEFLMKKTLVSALTTALVVGAASTTFAAANPFEDVPADHWAYDAVAQLAADGVIEGYGDGTYRGDQEITRYEMAQMIARAMAKNPNGADKALVDKLAAEFADELNNLGVRVAALEKKVDNVKWGGTVRYRYWVETHKGKRTTGERERSTVNEITLRLEPEMRINKHWTGHARLDYMADMKRATNTPNADEHDRGKFEIDRIWAQGDYNNLQIMLGKLPYVSFIDNGMLFDGNIAGGQLTVGNKVKATLTLGRWDGSDNNYDRDDENDHFSYGGIEVYNDRDDKITWGVGFHQIRDKVDINEALGDGKDTLNIWDVGLGWKMTDSLALNGAYAWNTAVNEGFNDELRGSKHAWSVELDYKGADPADKGSWGAYVAYRKLGALAAPAPTYDAIGNGQKGWELGFDYVPMKNFQASFKYFNGKDLVGDNGLYDQKATKFFTELNFFF
jgi:hypothetical protein